MERGDLLGLLDVLRDRFCGVGFLFGRRGGIVIAITFTTNPSDVTIVVVVTTIIIIIAVLLLSVEMMIIRSRMTKRKMACSLESQLLLLTQV